MSLEEVKLMELVMDSRVHEIIESKDHLELAKFLGREFCDFTTSDEKYIDIFWESTFNQSWLYLSEEMVYEQLGYKQSKYMMNDFYKKLIAEFEDIADYQNVNKDHVLVKALVGNLSYQKVAHNKRYYIITGETYKALLSSANTQQGKLTRKYFIKVERLANLTNQAIFKYIEAVKNRELAERDELLEQKDNQLNRLHRINAELLTHKKLSEKNESIYLVSTEHYVTQGLIKVGRTKNIKARSSSHNTTHIAGDKVKVLHKVKVNDSALVESIIHKKLAGLRPEKASEFFMCPFNQLREIVDMIIEYDNLENERVNILIDAVYLLKQREFSQPDWTAGLDMTIFSDTNMLSELKSIEPPPVEIDTTNELEQDIKQLDDSDDAVVRNY
jgi:phage anti-repressor protein